jgi:hypothetical protein
MKQGKNTPLDADEAEFLDAVVAHEQQTERRKRDEDAQELESFQARLLCLPLARHGSRLPCRQLVTA